MNENLDKAIKGKQVNRENELVSPEEKDSSVSARIQRDRRSSDLGVIGTRRNGSAASLVWRDNGEIVV
jgi:magnesium-transporting ATPase (P-type)